jgi:hypothetical protein
MAAALVQNTETRQKNVPFKSIEDLREAGATWLNAAPLIAGNRSRTRLLPYTPVIELSIVWGTVGRRFQASP